MKKSNFGVWVVRFIFCLCVIAAYKTFDNVEVIFGFVGSLISTLTPFVIGGVIAFFLYPICKKTEILLRKTNREFVLKHTRGIATLIVILATLLVVTVALLLIVPIFYNSIVGFVSLLPGYLNEIQTILTNWFGNSVWIDQVVAGMKGYLTFDNLAAILSSVDIGSYAASITQFFVGVFNALIGFIISIYLLLDRASLKKALIRISRLSIKERYTHRMEQLCSRISSVIYNFVFGQALDALIVATIIGVLLTLFKIPNSVLLAVVYFLFALIPYFGSTIGVICVALLSLLFGGIQPCIIGGIIALAMQQLDSNFINPRVVGHAVGIRPLYVILGITLFGGLFGLVGLFLGPPMMAIVLELLEAFLQGKERKRKLKERSLLSQVKSSLQASPDSSQSSPKEEEDWLEEDNDFANFSNTTNC